MMKMNYSFLTSPPESLLEASDLLHKNLQTLVNRTVVGKTSRFSAFEVFYFHLDSLPSRLGGLGIPFSSDVLQFAQLSAQIDACHLQGNLFPLVTTSLAELISNEF
ncbi:hypothetical protein EON65_03920 [archaeon]|nr:MAG: hypothetical protein EON65_03920 [archaeon]